MIDAALYGLTWLALALLLDHVVPGLPAAVVLVLAFLGALLLDRALLVLARLARRGAGPSPSDPDA